MLHRICKITAVLALAASLAACAGKNKEQYVGIDGDFVTGTPLPERRDGVSFTSEGVVKGQFAPVQFGFDSFVVAPAEESKVDTVARAMKDIPSDLIIAGFTDERGTEEYNRGLGEKRAQAVREALISRGVSAGRIQTVSFGEEMPVDPASSEAAWALNRRAEFGVIK